MNTALKLSTNIFLARLSNIIDGYFLFIIIGYVNGSVLGEFNIYFSFITVFDAIAAITFIYFQNEASRNKKDNLLFAKGFQISALFGIFVALIASLTCYFQFANSPLFFPILLTTITYPLLSTIAFISYYLEGVDKSSIVSQTHIAVSVCTIFLFFVLLKSDIYVALAASIAFCIKDVVTLSGLLVRSKKPIVLTKNLLSSQDFRYLIHRGIPLSLGATVTRYANSLVIIAIGLFGANATNLYTVSTRTVVLCLLPSIAISQSLSIYYGSSDNKSKEAMDCIKLHVMYGTLILGLVFLALPEILKIIFNYTINPIDILDTKLTVVACFLSYLLLTISSSMARAINFVKIPQIISCTGALAGLAIGKFLASNMFDFVYIVSMANGLAATTILALAFWWKTSKD